ncbi:MAG: sulfite exporter TauE/SafE family protein [Candidatus Firestonebacteria bacterium]
MTLTPFFEGFGLGLSTGGFCLIACVPFLVPYFLSEERKLRNSILVILEFLTGRLMAYLIFGLIFGIVGEQTKEILDKRIIGILIIITSLILLIYGFTKNFPEIGLCKIAGRSNLIKRFPFISGFLVGINICPPFLVSLSVLISLGSIFSALIFSFGFFLATTLFLWPVIFSSYFSKFTKIQEISQVATLLVGLYFLINGIIMVI